MEINPMDQPRITCDPIIDIPALIKWRGNRLTFIELKRYLPYLHGEQSLYLNAGKLERLVWTNVSQECIDAIQLLQKTRKIKCESVPEFLYLIEGGGLITKGKRDKWLPIGLSLGVGV
jgi:hypothetical protein